ncbi:efflux RND transporter periplasmic adaptor subunit [Nocardioides mangrovi]|uniref:Efflux RND transporter periplasmic adaptor subunit n=1 Tax=Nocardioides mangrovi TaxID=2874580 RepID=A0ABS7U6Y9_9ACTN|nr:efflux RND transporter periplasmic adaptor subunit [Nocardioides mangrovi]MBZ5736735.1 efflux RND transporter periplasmic adaptor subunit [Nocardioides mangrovi]
MRRPGRRARRVIAGGVVVAVVGVGYAAYAANADAPSYRTTSATTGDVEQTLDVSGSVEPAGRADLAFATSGTIESITVKAGQTVKAGEVLGELDDTSLRKTLQQARATLASARAQLESDEDAQADTVSSASSSSSTGSSSGGGTTTPSTGGQSTPTDTATDTPTDTPTDDPTTPTDDGGLSDALAELAAEQQAVVDAQSTVSASLTAAQDALAAQQTACTDAFSTDPGDPSDDPTTDPTDGATTDPGTGTGDDATNQACSDALTAVQTAQQQVSTDQDALQTALEDLSGTLTDAITALQQSGQSGGSDSSGGSDGSGGSGGSDTSTGGQGSQQQSSGSGSSGSSPASSGSGSASAASSSSSASSASSASSSSSMSGSTTVSAATLAQDQAAIDQARADVITAKEALRTATVTAPFAGKVVSVDAAEGDSVSSGTEVFIVVAPGTTTVQVDASSSEVQQLEVGQTATATPAGSDQELVGTVTQISTVPDDSSTYPVTITLKKKDLDIATGLNASVSIVTGTATDVVTVPASAVSDGVVMVVGDDGEATRTRVTTGVVGATTVEVTDGLEAGDEVVLADLKEALPTTDDSSTNQGGFGGGGFSGGGGGFPSGGSGFSPPSGGGGFPG